MKLLLVYRYDFVTDQHRKPPSLLAAVDNTTGSLLIVLFLTRFPLGQSKSNTCSAKPSQSRQYILYHTHHRSLAFWHHNIAVTVTVTREILSRHETNNSRRRVRYLFVYPRVFPTLNID